MQLSEDCKGWHIRGGKSRSSEDAFEVQGRSVYAFATSENHERSANYRNLPHMWSIVFLRSAETGQTCEPLSLRKAVTVFISSLTALDMEEWRVLETWVPWQARSARKAGRSFHISGSNVMMLGCDRSRQSDTRVPFG